MVYCISFCWSVFPFIVITLVIERSFGCTLSHKVRMYSAVKENDHGHHCSPQWDNANGWEVFANRKREKIECFHWLRLRSWIRYCSTKDKVFRMCNDKAKRQYGWAVSTHLTTPNWIINVDWSIGGCKLEELKEERTGEICGKMTWTRCQVLRLKRSIFAQHVSLTQRTLSRFWICGQFFNLFFWCVCVCDVYWIKASAHCFLVWLFVVCHKSAHRRHALPSRHAQAHIVHASLAIVRDCHSNFIKYPHTIRCRHMRQRRALVGRFFFFFSFFSPRHIFQRKK